MSSEKCDVSSLIAASVRNGVGAAKKWRQESEDRSLPWESVTPVHSDLSDSGFPPMEHQLGAEAHLHPRMWHPTCVRAMEITSRALFPRKLAGVKTLRDERERGR